MTTVRFELDGVYIINFREPVGAIGGTEIDLSVTAAVGDPMAFTIDERLTIAAEVQYKKVVAGVLTAMTPAEIAAIENAWAVPLTPLAVRDGLVTRARVKFDEAVLLAGDPEVNGNIEKADTILHMQAHIWVSSYALGVPGIPLTDVTGLVKYTAIRQGIAEVAVTEAIALAEAEAILLANTDDNNVHTIALAAYRNIMDALYAVDLNDAYAKESLLMVDLTTIYAAVAAELGL